MTLVLAMIFAYDTKSTSNKAKADKQGYLKLKSFCTGNEIINRVYRKLIEWEIIQGLTKVGL